MTAIAGDGHGQNHNGLTQCRDLERHLEVLNPNCRVIATDLVEYRLAIERNRCAHYLGLAQDLIEVQQLNACGVLVLQPIAVAVHETDQGAHTGGLRMLFQVGRADSQGLRQHHVVRIRCGDIFALGMGEAGIQCSANAGIGLVSNSNPYR